jgi:hypothetical protein
MSLKGECKNNSHHPVDDGYSKIKVGDKSVRRKNNFAA